jgi:hypothetical protein
VDVPNIKDSFMHTLGVEAMPLPDWTRFSFQDAVN